MRPDRLLAALLVAGKLDLLLKRATLRIKARVTSAPLKDNLPGLLCAIAEYRDLLHRGPRGRARHYGSEGPRIYRNPGDLALCSRSGHQVRDDAHKGWKGSAGFDNSDLAGFSVLGPRTEDASQDDL